MDDVITRLGPWREIKGSYLNKIGIVIYTTKTGGRTAGLLPEIELTHHRMLALKKEVRT